MGTGVILGMATLTVASSVLEGVFNSMSKVQEAQYCNLASKSMLICTALGCFGKVLTILRQWG